MWKTALLLIVVGIGPASHCNGANPPPVRHAGSGNEVAACNDGKAAACHSIGLKWAQAKDHPQSRFQSWKHFKMTPCGPHLLKEAVKESSVSPGMKRPVR